MNPPFPAAPPAIIGAAMMTLDGVIGVLATFPPESDSPEFEMVAAGLAPRLNQGERDALLRDGVALDMVVYGLDLDG